MNKSKNILVSPLDWGLGHATRLIPIIDYLISVDHNVVLCGSGNSLQLLKNKYPELLFEDLSSPTIRYGKKNAIGLVFIKDFLKLVLNIKKERKIVKQIIKKHNIDIIISDNRPGAYCKNIKSIYITHQLNIYPFKHKGILSYLAGWRHGKIIKQYSFCLVPDLDIENNLAGKLSAKSYKNTVHIGPLSRFTNNSLVINSEVSSNYDYVCILSGPEPQRTIFENLLIDLFSNNKYKCLIIRGLLSDKDCPVTVSNLSIINNCSDNEMFSYLKSNSIIICRSGYSSIMDLAVVEKKAILIPTPGQPEQEYLADYYKKNYNFDICYQKDLKHLDLDNIKNKRFTVDYDRTRLKKVLSKIL